MAIQFVTEKEASRGIVFQMDKGLERVQILSEWKEQSKSGAEGFDLDVGMVFLNDERVLPVPEEDYLIYFGNADKVVRPWVKYGGDDKTGAKGESLELLLSKVPACVTAMRLFIAIFKGKERRQSFGEIKDSHIKLIDLEKPAADQVFISYDLSKEYKFNTCIEVCEIFRENGSWTFKPLGVGSDQSQFDYMGTFIKA